MTHDNESDASQTELSRPRVERPSPAVAGFRNDCGAFAANLFRLVRVWYGRPFATSPSEVQAFKSLSHHWPLV